MSFSSYLLNQIGIPLLEVLGGILLLCLIIFFCLPMIWFPALVEIAESSAIAAWAVGAFFIGGWVLLLYWDCRAKS